MLSYADAVDKTLVHVVVMPTSVPRLGYPSRTLSLNLCSGVLMGSWLRCLGFDAAHSS